MTRDNPVTGTPPVNLSAGKSAGDTKTLKEGESPTRVDAPWNAPQGLRQTQVSIVTDKVDERIAALKKDFPDFNFTVADHDTRKKIVVSGEKNLDVPTLERMRRISRSL